jgi:hypothetical protein
MVCLHHYRSIASHSHNFSVIKLTHILGTLRKILIEIHFLFDYSELTPLAHLRMLAMDSLQARYAAGSNVGCTLSKMAINYDPHRFK